MYRSGKKRGYIVDTKLCNFKEWMVKADETDTIMIERVLEIRAG